MILDTALIFVTRLGSSFVEAVPFLLLGALASGLIDVLLVRDEMADILPRNGLVVTLLGVAAGMALPVGGIGAALVARRLMSKGLPASAGIAFLLAAPLLNPIAIAATIAAYGTGPIAITRIALGVAIPLVVGLIFALNGEGDGLLRAPDDQQGSVNQPMIEGQRWHTRALRAAGDEFFELGPYLAAGALLSAVAQTMMPRAALASVGAGPVISVAALSLLGFVQSNGAPLDALASLALRAGFTSGSIIAFLVFGSIADIRRLPILAHVLTGKAVAYLVVITLLLTILAAVIVNLWLSW